MHSLALAPESTRSSVAEPPLGSAESHLRPADIFFTRGTGLLSRAIRLFTRHVGESRTKVNHVGLVVEGGRLEDATVVEALSTVRRHGLWRRYARRRRTQVAVYRSSDLTDEEATRIVAKAEGYVGREYGWLMLVAHFLDWLLQGAYLFRRFVGSENYPICSWVVAHSYAKVGKTFGIEPGAATPDDIWDFAVERRPDLYRQIRALSPLQEGYMPQEEKRSIRIGNAIAVTVLLVGIPMAGLMAGSIRTRWILTAALIIAFLLVSARLQTGSVLGLLVDSRYKASVSRLQLVLWTILVLSAYSTAVLWNVSVNAADPLSVGIPPEIWAVLGISVTSFVGSPILKGRKEGQLVANNDPKAARTMDVLMGEEAGNQKSLDLSKVQMLLFTLILVVAYGAALYEILTTQAAVRAPILEFPDVSEGMIALLGLSHSGYLVYKTVDHPAPQPGSAPGGGS